MVNICAQSARNKKDGEKSYISLSLTLGPEEFELERIHDNLINVLDKYKIEPELNICITGYFEGRMDYKNLNKVSKKILKVQMPKGKRYCGEQFDKCFGFCTGY